MRALWLLSLVAMAVVVAGTSTKKPVSKKETVKKENNDSDLHKKLFLEASNVKKAIAERTEAALADQSGLFHRRRPIKDDVALNSQKPSGTQDTRRRPAPTKGAAANQRQAPSKGALSTPILDFFPTPADTRPEEEAVTTEEPLDQGTDVPVLLSRAALLQLLNMSADNLDKELKTITVGNAGITIGGFDPFNPGLTGPGLGIDKVSSTDLGTGIKGGITVGGVTIAVPNFATLIGVDGANGVTRVLATLFAIAAAIGAGLASLIAFVVPPLQIANQVLAIIAISLLIAYVVEDKKAAGEDPEYEYEDSGYGTGSGGYGYDMGSGLVSYGDTTGYSSYSDYKRRSDTLQPAKGFQPADSFADLVTGNSIDSIDPKKATTLGRSVGLVPMVNSVAKAVSSAVTSYSDMYGENPAL